MSITVYLAAYAGISTDVSYCIQRVL